ncbi:spirocyclase AveC family protein [Streptomyces sp. NPDC127190]|uniref:spirocyclase AveC family protein n=1 Tax=unclassified Streptomyces TaxID=2593676 RepID=UPI0036429254
MCTRPESDPAKAEREPARASAPPVRRRRPTPVVLWATVGALFLGLEAYVAVRYLASGQLWLSTGDLGTLSRTHQTLLWTAQFLVIVMVVPLVVWIARRCIAERRLTIDALLLLGFVSQAGLDPYFSPMGMLNSASLHIPSWGEHLPAWPEVFGFPDPSVKVEPLLVTGVGYLTGLVFALTAAAVMHFWVLRRWPNLSGIRLAATGLGICAGIGLPIEIIWIRTGAYAYREGVPLLTLFSTEWYQVPVYLPLTSGIFWYGTAWLIRHYYIHRGPNNTVFRGTTLLPPRARTPIRALAVIGILDVSVMLDCIAFRLFTLLPGSITADHLPLPFV